MVGVERLEQARGPTLGEREVHALGRDERELEIEQHLALGREQQIAISFAGAERLDRVGEQAVEKGQGLGAADLERLAARRVEQRRALGSGAVFVGDLAKGEHERRGARADFSALAAVAFEQEIGLHGRQHRPQARRFRSRSGRRGAFGRFAPDEEGGEPDFGGPASKEFVQVRTVRRDLDEGVRCRCP
jgi:hypothetical protein